MKEAIHFTVFFFFVKGNFPWSGDGERPYLPWVRRAIR